MKKKSAKRVDSLYRNLKQLPLLGGAGIVIPIIGVLVLPIAGAYMLLRSQLLNDIENGKIKLEKQDRVPESKGDLSTKDKIKFIRNASFALPLVAGCIWWGAMLILIITIATK